MTKMKRKKTMKTQRTRRMMTIRWRRKRPNIAMTTMEGQVIITKNIMLDLVAWAS